MTPAKRYAAFFESLGPDDLERERLQSVFSEAVHFRDPFNDVHGIESLAAVFRHMFEQTALVRFEVSEVVERDDIAYLRWRFHFRLRGDRADRRPVAGVSRIVLDAGGRVCEHIDYWDAAGELYTQFAGLGTLMRLLRRRLGAPTASGKR